MTIRSFLLFLLFFFMVWSGLVWRFGWLGNCMRDESIAYK